MSLGVNLLAALVKRVAQSLDQVSTSRSWNASPSKIDAPSGTALMLGEAAAAGRRSRSSSTPRGAATALRARVG